MQVGVFRIQENINIIKANLGRRRSAVLAFNTYSVLFLEGEAFIHSAQSFVSRPPKQSYFDQHKNERIFMIHNSFFSII